MASALCFYFIAQKRTREWNVLMTEDEEGNEMIQQGVLVDDDDGSLNNTMVLPYTTSKKWHQHLPPQQQ
jgi:hypothetical protein